MRSQPPMATPAIVAEPPGLPHHWPLTLRKRTARQRAFPPKRMKIVWVAQTSSGRAGPTGKSGQECACVSARLVPVCVRASGRDCRGPPARGAERAALKGLLQRGLAGFACSACSACSSACACGLEAASRFALRVRGMAALLPLAGRPQRAHHPPPAAPNRCTNTQPHATRAPAGRGGGSPSSVRHRALAKGETPAG